MTGVGPTSQRPKRTPAGEPPIPAAAETPGPPPSSAADRASRLNAANMLRSLLPLVVICLLIVGWQAFRQSGDEQIRTVDPSSTVRATANRASYPLVVPTGLAAGYRTTSVHTNSGSAGQGDPVTLQIGYLTPKGEYAGFVESDDPRADALTAVLDGAREKGSVQLAGGTWTRETTGRGETALVQRSGDVTVVVTGSASDRELETVAGAVRPYSG
jgi:hypothetical protein